MAAPRRLRSVLLAVAFATIALYYLTHQRNVWNYGYSSYSFPPPKPRPQDGKVHWSKLSDRYPVTSFIPLPTGSPKKIPLVQANPPKEDAKQKEERLRRRDAVKESFQHSWKGYKDHAWLRDEVTPISGKYRDTFGGWAATLVDALDTLWIMGMKDDFAIAVNAAQEIDFTTTETDLVNVFETTIRYMGGFLAAYDISGGKYPFLLDKAVEVGELLMSCFDTPNRMPITRWDWQAYSKGDPQKAPANMLVSEIGSLSLEFTRLSQLTGDPKYYDAIQRISNELELAQNSTQLPGLWPVSINAEIPSFAEDNFFTLGGMSDSLYEYLPKQYLLHGGLLSQPRNLYEKFIDVAKTTLFFRIYNPENKNLTVSGDIRVEDKGTKLDLRPRGQHLTCFTGGMVALGSRIFSRPQDLEVAEELAQGCMWAYDSNANGIAPELFTVMPCPKNYPCTWDEKVWHDKLIETHPPPGDEPKSEQEIEKQVKSIVEGGRYPPGFTSIDDRRYILRPEAIESVFILYRVTGKQIYADAAWRMFQAVESVSRTPVAAAAIRDITISPLKSGKGIVTEGANQGFGNNDQAAENDGTGIEGQKTDSMESFWLAETLKYFYLCFEEWDVVSLDDWVLNTEAHPLRRPGR